MTMDIDNNDMYGIDDASSIAQLVAYIEDKLYLLAIESAITFAVIVVLTITIIFTIIPAVVDGNHYGSYPSYFDKNYIEYGITCWMLDQYSALTYVFDVLNVPLQIAALYMACDEHKQNESTKYNTFNNIIQKQIEKLRERQRERLQDCNMINTNFNNNRSTNSSRTSTVASSIQRNSTDRSSHERTRTLFCDEQSIIIQGTSLIQSLTKRAQAHTQSINLEFRKTNIHCNCWIIYRSILFQYRSIVIKIHICGYNCLSIIIVETEILYILLYYKLFWVVNCFGL